MVKVIIVHIYFLCVKCYLAHFCLGPTNFMFLELSHHTGAISFPHSGRPSGKSRQAVSSGKQQYLLYCTTLLTFDFCSYKNLCVTFLGPFLEDGHDPTVNPFKMPLDNDIFQRRDQERLRKKQVRSGLYLYIFSVVCSRLNHL